MPDDVPFSATELQVEIPVSSVISENLHRTDYKCSADEHTSSLNDEHTSSLNDEPLDEENIDQNTVSTEPVLLGESQAIVVKTSSINQDSVIKMSENDFGISVPQDKTDSKFDSWNLSVENNKTAADNNCKQVCVPNESKSAISSPLLKRHSSSAASNVADDMGSDSQTDEDIISLSEEDLSSADFIITNVCTIVEEEDSKENGNTSDPDNLPNSSEGCKNFANSIRLKTSETASREMTVKLIDNKSPELKQISCNAFVSPHSIHFDLVGMKTSLSNQILCTEKRIEKDQEPDEIAENVLQTDTISGSLGTDLTESVDDTGLKTFEETCHAPLIFSRSADDSVTDASGSSNCSDSSEVQKKLPITTINDQAEINEIKCMCASEMNSLVHKLIADVEIESPGDNDSKAVADTCSSAASTMREPVDKPAVNDDVIEACRQVQYRTYNIIDRDQSELPLPPCSTNCMSKKANGTDFEQNCNKRQIGDKIELQQNKKSRVEETSELQCSEHQKNLQLGKALKVPQGELEILKEIKREQVDSELENTGHHLKEKVASVTSVNQSTHTFHPFQSSSSARKMSRPKTNEPVALAKKASIHEKPMTNFLNKSNALTKKALVHKKVNTKSKISKLASSSPASSMKKSTVNSQTAQSRLEGESFLQAVLGSLKPHSGVKLANTKQAKKTPADSLPTNLLSSQAISELIGNQIKSGSSKTLKIPMADGTVRLVNVIFTPPYVNSTASSQSKVGHKTSTNSLVNASCISQSSNSLINKSSNKTALASVSALPSGVSSISQLSSVISTPPKSASVVPIATLLFEPATLPHSSASLLVVSAALPTTATATATAITSLGDSSKCVTSLSTCTTATVTTVTSKAHPLKDPPVLPSSQIVTQLEISRSSAFKAALNGLASIKLCNIKLSAEEVSSLIQRKNTLPSYEPAVDCPNTSAQVKNFLCIECGDRFATIFGYNSHIKRMSYLVIFACSLCEVAFVFFNKCSFLWHLRLHTKPNQKSSTVISLDCNSLIICSIPQPLLPDIRRQYMESHVDDHNFPVDCPECRVTCPNIEKLAEHFDTDSSICTFNHECKYCGMQLPSDCSLKAHERLHATDSNVLCPRPPYVCPECGISFPQQVSLCQHLHARCFHFYRIVPGTCRLCNTHFFSRLQIDQMRTHTFKCHWRGGILCISCCHKFYMTSSYRFHTSVPPHQIKDNLLKNQQLHCGNCKTSITESEKNEHLKIHIESFMENPNYAFACNLCYFKRLFTSKALLNEHLNMVHKAFRYSCTFCKKGFLQLGDLRSHVLLHHKTNVTCQACAVKVVLHAAVPHAMWHVVKQLNDCGTSQKDYVPLDIQIPASFNKKKTLSLFCRICGRMCTTHYLMQQHLSTHNFISKQMCLTCQRMDFGSKNECKKHQDKCSLATLGEDDVADAEEGEKNPEKRNEKEKLVISPAIFSNKNKNIERRAVCGQNLPNTSETGSKDKALFALDRLKISLENKQLSFKQPRVIIQPCDQIYPKIKTEKHNSDAKKIILQQASVNKLNMYSCRKRLPQPDVTSLKGEVAKKRLLQAHVNKLKIEVSKKKQSPPAFPENADNSTSSDEEGSDDGELVFPPLLFEKVQAEPVSRLLHPCHLCGLTYSSEEMLMNHHASTHSGAKSVLLCQMCRKRGKNVSFGQKDLLTKHYIRKHRLSAEELENMTQNSLVNSPPLKPGETLPSYEKIKSPLSAAPVPVKRLRVAGESEQDYVCAKCSFSATSVEEFHHHISSHADGNSHQCLECGLCFSVIPSLKRHLFMVHHVANTDAYLEEHKITDADLPKELKSHLDQFQNFSESIISDVIADVYHEGINRRECVAVDKEDTDRKNKNPLECTVCYRVFENEGQLRLHMRTHGMAFIRSKRLIEREMPRNEKDPEDSVTASAEMK